MWRVAYHGANYGLCFDVAWRAEGKNAQLAMHRNAFSITRRFGAGPGKWQHRPTRLQHLRFLATRQEPDTGKAPLEHTNANKEFLVKNDSNANGVEEQNGLSRRLEQYTEEALCENPRFMKAAVASGEFDFNKELKQKLLDRIASADFNSKNAQALATASLPVRIYYPSHGTVWQLTRDG